MSRGNINKSNFCTKAKHFGEFTVLQKSTVLPQSTNTRVVAVFLDLTAKVLKVSVSHPLPESQEAGMGFRQEIQMCGQESHSRDTDRAGLRWDRSENDREMSKTADGRCGCSALQRAPAKSISWKNCTATWWWPWGHLDASVSAGSRHYWSLVCIPTCSMHFLCRDAAGHGDWRTSLAGHKAVWQEGLAQGSPGGTVQALSPAETAKGVSESRW